ncbi:MAG: penicillin-binding transpeptidase domain-containing protein, partial [Bryobacteraceae bacterium]
AGSVIANGGLMVKPRLVISRQKPGGRPEVFPQEKPRRIIRPETAIMMRQMMEGVVLHGTGRRYATLRGYTSGGKTGSAQIYDQALHAYSHHYNASFLGFAPVADPQIVIVATLEGTSGGEAGFGAPVAGPVFREVAMSALRMLDVPKDLPDQHTPEAPDKLDDHYDLAIAGLSNAPMGKASSQSKNFSSDVALSSDVTPPPARTGASLQASVSSRRPFFDNVLAGPKIPDFQGMTLRAVLEESSEKGLSVETSGDPGVGLVRAQDPSAGTILPPGMRVRVQFAR